MRLSLLWNETLSRLALHGLVWLCGCVNVFEMRKMFHLSCENSSPQPECQNLRDNRDSSLCFFAQLIWKTNKTRIEPHTDAHTHTHTQIETRYHFCFQMDIRSDGCENCCDPFRKFALGMTSPLTESVLSLAFHFHSGFARRFFFGSILTTFPPLTFHFLLLLLVFLFQPDHCCRSRLIRTRMYPLLFIWIDHRQSLIKNEPTCISCVIWNVNWTGLNEANRFAYRTFAFSISDEINIASVPEHSDD